MLFPTTTPHAKLTEWENPSPAWRGKPFWSWNGRLDREELLRQARVFADMGMGGFFMHSRTGLETPYLGDEWFDLINACADEAERLGLEAWLYDEDRWPSGSAGGLATRELEHRMRYLRLTVADASFAFPAGVHPVAFVRAELDGLHLGKYERVETPSELKPGEALLAFAWEFMPEHSFYNGSSYLNTLDESATRHFLDVTHERYRVKCGDRLGRSIKGVFTDEPHHGFVMCDKLDQAGPRDPAWLVPWTHRIPSEFQQAFGYDLVAKLPELFLQRNGRAISPVKWQFMELLQRLFLKNWAEPCADWCRRHGLLLTGHMLHEDTLTAQAVPCGSAMRYYETMDWPGIDVLGNDNRAFWLAKPLQSVGRQLGKPWLLSELYGCSGWQFDFAGHKAVGTWQTLLGINVRCHHLSWVTMAGEAKRDYPASISFQSAWHRDYAAVETYFARLGFVLAQGEPVCDVLVVNPVESVWARIHPGWATWLGPKHPDLSAIEQTYQDVFSWLSSAQIDFDYGDEEQMSRLAAVETEDGTPVLRVGRMRYRVVLVAGLETVRGSTLRLLESFVAAGGRVVFAGRVPMHVDAVESGAAAALAAASQSVSFSRAAVVEAVGAASAGPLRLSDAPDVLCQVRRDGEAWFVALANTSHSQTYPRLELHLAVDGIVEEWDCDTGARHARASGSLDGGRVWSTDLPPLGTRVFYVSPRGSGAVAVAGQEPDGGRLSVTDPLAYELDEPNLAVLDMAEWKLGTDEWQPATEVMALDGLVRRRLGLPPRAGDMLQPWARPATAFEPLPLILRFAFYVDTVPAGDVELLVERPESAELLVNGVPVALPASTDWHIDPCFRRVPLPRGCLTPGLNHLEVRLAFTPSTDVEAVQLAGTFGVAIRGTMLHLTTLPERLQASDVVAQGLPFYSGSILYRVPVPAEVRGGVAVVEVGGFGGALARIELAGGTTERLMWPPWRTRPLALSADEDDLRIRVVLTRRNTFGPLHQVPREQPGIGPANFRSVGEAFSPEPQLFPSGLLQPPTFLPVAGAAETVAAAALADAR